MAKRRRLNAHHASRPPGGPGADPGRGRVPIADVAGDVAGEAAADEVGAELLAARREGRLVQALPLGAVEAGHLLRDRLPGAAEAGGEEMGALIASIRASGQRAPIETVELGAGPDGSARYGLISGWRRLAALRHLSERGEGPGTVLAIVRAPQGAAASYLAMVEENEIRAPLSFWERAHLVSRAVGAGVFEDEADALRALFASAPRARRSKIGAFLPVVAALDGALPFPAALTERAGLSLSKAIRADAGFGAALAARLAADPPADPEAQAAAIEAALRAAQEAGTEGGRSAAKPSGGGTPPEVTLRRQHGRLILEGADAADPEFEARLRRWLARPRG